MRLLLSLLFTIIECVIAASGTPSIQAAAPKTTDFIAAYTAAEQTFLDTLLPNIEHKIPDPLSILIVDKGASDTDESVASLKDVISQGENAASYDDVRYLQNAVRLIRGTLKDAAALWENDAAESGNEQTRPIVGGIAVRNGEVVQLEGTFSAKYDPDAGCITVSATEDGRLKYHAEYRKTEYGYIAQYYEPADRIRDRRSFRVLITLRDGNGIIGIEENDTQPGALSGLEAYASPHALARWFSLEGEIITIHSIFGAEMTFDAIPLP